MIESGLSYGKSHNMFFLFGGIISLLVWSSIVSLDKFWKDNFYEEVAKVYPFISNFGAFIGILSYDRVNKYFSFKTQLLSFPFALLFSFTVLFALGQFNEENENKNFTLKDLVFILIVFVQGGISTVLQTSLTRYTFNFSKNEISLFNGGGAISGIIFSLLFIIVTLFPLENNDDDTKKFEPSYVWWFLGVLTLFVLIVFFIFKKYINNFLDKEDDLTGETDTLREIVENEEKNTQTGHVFKKVLAMFFCLILCYAVTLACFPTLTLAVGNNWFKGRGGTQKSAAIALIFNLFDFLGKFCYKYLPMKDNILVYIYSLLRIFFVLFYVLATDQSLNNSFFQNNNIVGYGLLILMAFTNGHFTSVAFSLASERCENKSKKTCGYLMNVSLFIGLVYGGLISSVCFDNKVVEN